jgi:outer membrane protein
MPVASVLYGRFFFGGASGAGTPGGIGMNIVKNEHWRFGVGFGAETRKPRYVSDDPVLRGWGDIRSTQRGSALGSYRLDWFSARAAISQDISGKHEGALVSLGMEGRFHPIDRLTLSAGPEAVWGVKDYTQTFFGIDSTQSAISGLLEYPVRTRFNTVRFAVGADYRLTRKWSLGAHAAYGRTIGDAADSPVTGDKTQCLCDFFGVSLLVFVGALQRDRTRWHGEVLSIWERTAWSI